jgi:hypothetical protein
MSATTKPITGKGGAAANATGGASGAAEGTGGSPAIDAGSMISTPSQPTTTPTNTADSCAKDGETKTCLVDPKSTTLAEACNRGTMECKAGHWTTCVGKPMAVAETCNKLDDDCNGVVDDLTEKCYPSGQAGCLKKPDGMWSCAGMCATGTRTCRDGKLTECLDAITPAASETCTPATGVVQDENCNNESDEGCACVPGETQTCYTGGALTLNVGICRAGSLVCSSAGKLGPCMNDLKPGTETCQNMGTDDDCDGTVDNFPAALGSTCVVPMRATCSSGTLQCVGSSPMPQCVGPQPTAELCNGKDEDCDGVADNGFNLTTDAKNCGACGNACRNAQACCDSGCVSLNTKAHCGSCGNKCGANQMCSAGTCVQMPVAGMPAGGAGATGGTGGSSPPIGGMSGNPGSTGGSGGAGAAGGAGGTGGGTGAAGGTGTATAR